MLGRLFVAALLALAVPLTGEAAFFRGDSGSLSSLGADGDFHFNDSTEMLGKKTSGAWGQELSFEDMDKCAGPCDLGFDSDGGYVRDDIMKKSAGAWPDAADVTDARSQHVLASGGILGSRIPDIEFIPCNETDITTEIQDAIDSGKAVLIGRGSCQFTGIDMESRLWFSGMGAGGGSPVGTRLEFRGSGCAFRTPSTANDISQSYIGNFQLGDEGTGTDSDRHGFCFDGLSNNTILENIDIRDFHHQIRLRGADSDNSAAFYGTIRNLFTFRSRGCTIQVERNPDTNANPLTLLTIENFDSGRAIEGFLCLNNIRTTETNIMISGGIIDCGTDQTPAIMPIVVKVRGGSPTSGTGSPYATITYIGVEHSQCTSTNIIDSDIDVRVVMLGADFSRNPATPEAACGGDGLAINLPGTSNDVACLDAHGGIVSRPGGVGP